MTRVRVLGTIVAPGIIWNGGSPDADSEPTQATKPAWGLPLGGCRRSHVGSLLGCLWDQHLRSKGKRQDWFEEEVGMWHHPNDSLSSPMRSSEQGWLFTVVLSYDERTRHWCPIWTSH